MTAWICSTNSGDDARVVIAGNVPPAPPAPVQDTDQRIASVAVTGPPAVTRRNWNPHPPPEGGPPPSAVVHARPGPSHDTGLDPSPGSNTNAVGTTRTVDHTDPTDAVRDSGRHVCASVQYHVHRFTQVCGTPDSSATADGERWNEGTGIRNDANASCANCAGDTDPGMAPFATQIGTTTAPRLNGHDIRNTRPEPAGCPDHTGSEAGG